MVLPGGFSVVADLLFAGFGRNSIRPGEPRQPPALFALSVYSPGIRFENFTPRAQTGCTRAKMPPHYWSTLTPSIFAEWGLIEAKYRRGVFRVENLTVDARLRATVSHAQV